MKTIEPHTPNLTSTHRLSDQLERSETFLAELYELLNRLSPRRAKGRKTERSLGVEEWEKSEFLFFGKGEKEEESEFRGIIYDFIGVLYMYS